MKKFLFYCLLFIGICIIFLLGFKASNIYNFLGANAGYALLDSSGYISPSVIPKPSIITVTSSRYLALTDAENWLRATTTTVLTVPSSTGANFPVGTTIVIESATANAVSVAADTGVTIATENGLILNAASSTASLFKTETDTWNLSGSLKSS